MDTDSLGKLIPRLLLPRAQEWAECAGHSFLSEILMDKQFGLLIERIGEQLELRARSNLRRTQSGPDQYSSANPFEPPIDKETVPETRKNASRATDMRRLQDRLSALEAQQEFQQAIFETLRKKIRPLALALGCCPECLVGVEGCANCDGKSKVAAFGPDLDLLQTEVIKPLASRGIPLNLSVGHESDLERGIDKPNSNGKEHKHVSSDDGQRVLGKRRSIRH
jgi:hypothetical protein